MRDTVKTNNVAQFVEAKIKEFAAMYSYDCTYNCEDLCFHLKPNNQFPQVRNSFRPEINVLMNQNMDREIEISLSLRHPVRAIIATLYILLFAFGGVLSYFALIGRLNLTGIVVWGALFVFTTALVCFGRLITFQYIFLKLQRFLNTPLKGLRGESVSKMN